MAPALKSAAVGQAAIDDLMPGELVRTVRPQQQDVVPAQAFVVHVLFAIADPRLRQPARRAGGPPDGRPRVPFCMHSNLISAPSTTCSTPHIIPPLLQAAEEDLLYEEELLRNPFSLKMWWRYITARTDSAAKRRYLLYERALKALPGSYKVSSWNIPERRQEMLGEWVEGWEMIGNESKEKWQA